MSLLTLPLRREDLVVAAVVLDEVWRLWSSAPSRFARAYDLRDWAACGTHEVSPVGAGAGARWDQSAPCGQHRFRTSLVGELRFCDDMPGSRTGARV